MEPAVKVVTVSVAAPPLRVAVPSAVAPSRNVMVPEAVPEVAVTEATRRTLDPAGAGLGETARAVAVATVSGTMGVGVEAELLALLQPERTQEAMSEVAIAAR